MSFIIEVQEEFTEITNRELFQKYSKNPFLVQMPTQSQNTYIVVKVINREEVLDIGVIELNQSNLRHIRHIGVIKNIFVLEEWKSRSIPDLLLQKAIEVANDKSLVKLQLTLPDTKIVDIAEKLGFAKIARLEKEYFLENKFLTALFLERFI
jgi:GNAT superfamily N-acetyltransferase